MTAAVSPSETWERRGLVLARPGDGKHGSVIGDPCIVWDDEISSWRMFLFVSTIGQGQVVSLAADDLGLPQAWSAIHPLDETARPAGRSLHKPYVVQEARHPNRAARINGEYWLLTVASDPSGTKDVYRARSRSLAGPWRWEAEPLIPTGGPGAFDEKHADAVSGFHFPERGEVLYFYMGYPRRAQSRAGSPFGSAQGAAVQDTKGGPARKLGEILSPSTHPGHWAGGYLGGLQLLPGRRHRWVALLNASPTAPDPADPSDSREEPPPSLGGWAFCDEEWPVKNWRYFENPIEWVADIPESAQAEGESTNLWRHHALILREGTVGLFYNSGPYGKEQLYLKVSRSLRST